MQHATKLRTTTSWAQIETVLERAAPLPDEGAAAVWHALMEGHLLIEAETCGHARRMFLARAASGERLSHRERKIARLVGRGLPNKVIAAELDLSMAAVARGIDGAITKLGLGTRVALAILCAAFDPAAERSRSCARFAHLDEGRVALGAWLAESPLWQQLSSAERAVAELALAGHAGATIARLRGDRSARTVANQLKHVFRKAGVSGRTELAARLVTG